MRVSAAVGTLFLATVAWARLYAPIQVRIPFIETRSSRYYFADDSLTSETGVYTVRLTWVGIFVNCSECAGFYYSCLFPRENC